MSNLHATLSCLIITMSDRAFKKIYKDESGPLLEELMQKYLSDKRVKLNAQREILPDDKILLKNKIQQHINSVDTIFISGGTGIGPRDITPEVVKPLLDKEIPGIMEMIRVKYGMKFPNALLSRGVAGVADQTLIYAIPGNPKAVKDYMNEILPTILHSIKMLKGEGH